MDYVDYVTVGELFNALKPLPSNKRVRLARDQEWNSLHEITAIAEPEGEDYFVLVPSHDDIDN